MIELTLGTHYTNSCCCCCCPFNHLVLLVFKDLGTFLGNNPNQAKLLVTFCSALKGHCPCETRYDTFISVRIKRNCHYCTSMVLVCYSEVSILAVLKNRSNANNDGNHKYNDNDKYNDK